MSRSHHIVETRYQLLQQTEHYQVVYDMYLIHTNSKIVPRRLGVT